MENAPKKPVVLDAEPDEDGVYRVPPLGLLAEEDDGTVLDWKVYTGVWGIRYADPEAFRVYNITGT